MSNLMVNNHHNALQIRNATVTTLSHHAKDLWKSPSGTVIRIEVLVVVSASVFLFLAICGSKRRRSTDWFIQKGVFSAYVLSFSLVTYTLGSMQSSTVKNSMYPIWAISLFILDGCTDSITAYSLDDNMKDTRLIYQAFMYVAYGVFLVITILSVLGKSVSLRSAVLYLCGIAFNKIIHKQAAYVLASRSWNMNKMVADYMYDEHKKGKFDPVTMEGCHYLVDWPLDKSTFCALSYATQLTNGKSSLEVNEANCLLRACAQDMHSDSNRSQTNENQTHLILTWHVATCYCEMGALKYLCPIEGTELKIHMDVATKLSKYCAHLVVSAPKFLPGHHYDTTRVFDAVAEEAVEFLQSSTDKYEAMRTSADSDDTIFKSGIKLEKQLERIQDVTQRWKVMADFWAEMMLYVAPSDKLKEHMEQLAKGGEFITYLWALLSHAGILERDQHNCSHPNAENTQNSLDHQETEEDSLIHEAATAPPLRRRIVVDALPAHWLSGLTEFLSLTLTWNIFNSSARHAMLVPVSLMRGFSLQTPPSSGVQAGQPAPEIVTANERRIDIPETSSSIHVASTS